MSETKVVYIPPRYYEKMIHAYHCFGWRLQSSIIISDGYYLLPDYDTKKQFRNFYRCEFTREIDEESKNVLSSLEAEFELIKVDVKKVSKGGHVAGVIIFAFFTFVFLMTFLSSLDNYQPTDDTFTIFIFLFFMSQGFAVNLMFLIMKNNKNYAADKENIRRFNRRDYILREAYRIASRSNKTNGLK